MLVGIRKTAPTLGIGIDPLSAIITSGLGLVVGDSGRAQAQLIVDQQAAERRNIYIGGGALLAAALLVLVATKNS